MMHEPKRLLDDATTDTGARALLAAARRVPPVSYDAVRGAARLRVALESSGAALGASELSAQLSGVKRTRSALAGSKATVQGVALWKGGLLLLSLVTALSIAYRLATPAPATTDVAPRQALSSALGAANDGVQPSVRPLEPVTHEGTSVRPASAAEHTPRGLAGSRRAASHGHGGPALAQSPRNDVTRSRGAPSARASAASATTRSLPLTTGTPVPAARGTHSERAAEAQRSERAVERTRPPERPLAEPASPPLDELGAVAEVRRLLAPNPRAALALLQRLARERPQGYFLEEREALTILALAADGQPAAAQRRARQFLEAHANSPFIDRVRMATTP